MNDQREFVALDTKCACGCGDQQVRCGCGYVMGYRHRFNHVCIEVRE